MNVISSKCFWLYIRLKYGYNSNFRYLLRVLKNRVFARFYSAFGYKKFVLRGVDFAVTFTCNFNCDHCYAKRLSTKNRREMQIEDFKRVREEAMKMGVTTFSLQGGEVFLHKQSWEEVIKACQPKKNNVVITTNGSLVNEDKIKKMKELGVSTIYFSIDSGIAEEHDKFRKSKGNFSKIMKNIELCKKYGLKVIINTCVGKYNIFSAGLKMLLDFSHKNRILICTLLARPLGNWNGNFEALMSDKEMNYLHELHKRYPFAIQDQSNNYGGRGCQALKEYVYITAYGDVCPCPFTHIVLGNIFVESLKDIRERGLKAKWWDHYHSVCLTARDEEFMNLYYPLIQDKSPITLEEFME